VEASPLVVWTVGHSVVPVADLIGSLSLAGVRAVADVRAFPGSRRHPQYGRDALEASLAASGVTYRWLGRDLGGRRGTTAASRNVSLRVAAFRGFADHMATDAFRRGIDDLVTLGRETPTAVLCAEALWWRCHRSLIADHLVLVRGARVMHVRGGAAPTRHVPRPEARVEGDHLVYDGAPGEPLFDGAD
jgi:uncharacterized protein (DUF488 family)